VCRSRPERRLLRGRTAGYSSVAALFLAVAFLIPPAALAAGPPQIGAVWVGAVTATSADLHAEVDPAGLAAGYRFEYLSEAAYEANVEAGRDGFSGAATAPATGEAGLGEEETAQPALQRLERLTPATAYRFRLLATNSAGPAVGAAHFFATQSTGGAGPEECANAQLRIEDGSTGLPDCRAWELVSPADKNGGAIGGSGASFGGGVLQAAAAGGEVTYSSSASFGAEAAGAPPASQYLSRRGTGGWQTQNITAPTLSGAYGTSPESVPYQLFSPDLARGLMLDGRRCQGAEACPRSYSLRGERGGLEAALEAPDLQFAGSSPDLAHLVFSTCAALTPEASEIPSGGGGCDPETHNLYEWGGGAVQLPAAGRLRLPDLQRPQLPAFRIHRRLRRRRRRLLPHRRLAGRRRSRLGRPLRRPRRRRLPGARSVDPLRRRCVPGGSVAARRPLARHPRPRAGQPAGPPPECPPQEAQEAQGQEPTSPQEEELSEAPPSQGRHRKGRNR
jgi:hypothetical protein